MAWTKRKLLGSTPVFITLTDAHELMVSFDQFRFTGPKELLHDQDLLEAMLKAWANEIAGGAELIGLIVETVHEMMLENAHNVLRWVAPRIKAMKADPEDWRRATELYNRVQLLHNTPDEERPEMLARFRKWVETNYQD